MEGSDQRLVLGMNRGDGRQTPPGELRTPTEEGEEPRTPVPEATCDGDGDAKAPQRVEEEEEELDPRIQVRKSWTLLPAKFCLLAGL